MDPRLLARPWQLLRTRWPWTCAAYLACEVVAGWVTILAMATVVLLPAWARVWGANERRLVTLAGNQRIVTPTRRAGTAWREAAYLLVTVLVAFVGTIAAAAVATVLVMTLFAPWWTRVATVDLAGVRIDTPAEYAGAVALGVLVLAVALWAATAVAVGLSRLAGIVLGPDAAELQRTVDVLAERAVRVQDDLALERRELERRLHDGAQVHLSAAAARLGLLELDLADLPERDREPLLETLESVREQLDATGDAIRQVVHGLVPLALVEQGLGGAIAALTADLPLKTQVCCRVPRLVASAEASAYLIITEAVTNVLKHAEARRLTIEGEAIDDEIVFRIVDDGRGGVDLAGGGVLGMQARARSLGGRLSVASPVGGPTTVALCLPGRLVA